MEDHLQSLSLFLICFFQLASMRMTVLHLLMRFILFLLHTVHSSLRAIFLVVLAFLWKIGFVCPPKPDCFMSYLLLPISFIQHKGKENYTKIWKFYGIKGLFIISKYLENIFIWVITLGKCAFFSFFVLSNFV